MRGKNGIARCIPYCSSRKFEMGPWPELGNPKTNGKEVVAASVDARSLLPSLADLSIAGLAS
jgi:hypothetical protein